MLTPHTQADFPPLPCAQCRTVSSSRWCQSGVGSETAVECATRSRGESHVLKATLMLRPCSPTAGFLLPAKPRQPPRSRTARWSRGRAGERIEVFGRAALGDLIKARTAVREAGARLQRPVQVRVTRKVWRGEGLKEFLQALSAQASLRGARSPFGSGRRGTSTPKNARYRIRSMCVSAKARCSVHHTQQSQRSWSRW